ncbi:MAG TPA: hypothetical protein VMT95_15700 [Candidatus Binatia bacterium]|nr:hypothetical protein [Candidatus Binatia bacterium]
MDLFQQHAAGISAIVAAFAFCVSAGTFVFSAVQYKQANTLRRFEKYYDMSKRFDDNETVQEVIGLLRASESEKLRQLALSKKETFICFIEDVAVMQNSGLINPALAAYTFGYYVQTCLQNNDFWAGLNRDDPFFKTFREFATNVEGRIALVHGRDIRV